MNDVTSELFVTKTALHDSTLLQLICKMLSTRVMLCKVIHLSDILFMINLPCSVEFCNGLEFVLVKLSVLS